MRLKYTLFLFLFIIFSCNDEVKKELPPKNLIEKEKFTNILEELMMIEHQAQNDYPNFDELYPVLDTSSNTLMKKYETDLKTFEESYKYYASDLNLIKNIYSKILEKMARKLNVKPINEIKEKEFNFPK